MPILQSKYQYYTGCSAQTAEDGGSRGRFPSHCPQEMVIIAGVPKVKGVGHGAKGFDNKGVIQ